MKDEAGKAKDEARKAKDEAGEAKDEAGKAKDEAGKAKDEAGQRKRARRRLMICRSGYSVERATSNDSPGNPAGLRGQLLRQRPVLPELLVVHLSEHHTLTAGKTKLCANLSRKVAKKNDDRSSEIDPGEVNKLRGN